MDYNVEYQKAHRAYEQANYQAAGKIIDGLIQVYPEDANSQLLRGHIYLQMGEYNIAYDSYQLVLQITQEPQLLDYAQKGIEYIQEFAGMNTNINNSENEFENFHWTSEEEGEATYFHTAEFEQHQSKLGEEFNDDMYPNPFAMDMDNENFMSGGDLTSDNENPFAFAEEFTSETQKNWQPASKLESGPNNRNGEEITLNYNNNYNTPEINIQQSEQSFFNESDFANMNFAEFENNHNYPDQTADVAVSFDLPQSNDTATLIMMPKYNNNNKEGRTQSNPSKKNKYYHNETEENNVDYQEEITLFAATDDDSFAAEADFDFDALKEAINNDPIEAEIAEGKNNRNSSNNEILQAFPDLSDEIIATMESMSDFGFNDSSISSSGYPLGLDQPTGDLGNTDGFLTDFNKPSNNEEFTFTSTSSELNITDSQIVIPTFTSTINTDIEPSVTVEQGWLGFFENAELKKKQWLMGITAGLASTIIGSMIGFGIAEFTPYLSKNKEAQIAFRNTSWVVSVIGGLAAFGSTVFLGSVVVKQIKQTTEDLQEQFQSIAQNNFNVQAKIYSEDDFGKLAAGFNQMARVIAVTTQEAQQNAKLNEQSKEDLQRQVIRLLDDVEGAARGDLTVKAEVTPDVLGAVADSFNLTIENLGSIVKQVKDAAKLVNKSATDSDAFARGLSSDALRQAEELAVTLNSVQVMTDSIQRVAESASEAEKVARSASATALKGGEAVGRTVEGILQIRETVSETTRKVKRLAEAAQDIGKIVALIASISSRTNLLALNVSIEAARAGESGRGFAIVADEVRQLADRSAKSLKDIEKIVYQIQQETGSVMQAMEQGTQQVIEGTKRAQVAKGALEDIIQVSNRIDALVRSITADTVEQTVTSRAVAQVMQSVELTAQETSQESQRVSVSLSNLVNIARDLLNSVEKFRTESGDKVSR